MPPSASTPKSISSKPDKASQFVGGDFPLVGIGFRFKRLCITREKVVCHWLCQCLRERVKFGFALAEPVAYRRELERMLTNMIRKLNQNDNQKCPNPECARRQLSIDKEPTGDKPAKSE